MPAGGGLSMHTMEKALSMVDTTIGKKIVMALSGIVLFGFVFGHMLGNLQIFIGPKTFNDYSAFLHENPTLLWVARGVIGLSAGLHLWSAVSLWLTNRAARPQRYAKHRQVATTYAARTMVWTGPIVLLYLAYHLAHLTFCVTDGLGYSHDPEDVYTNVINSFRFWPAAAAYVVANLALGFHLYHGTWSLLQTLGVSHPRYNELLRSVAIAFGLLVATGFVAIPVAVLADHYGFVDLLH
jgi:succinate dehydrogenase / fumarate reductase cytochrome b subunit